MGIRYNDKRERFQDVTFGEDYNDFVGRVVRNDNETGLTLVEYYLPRRREHLYIIATPYHAWVNTQNYNLVDYVFNHLRRWLHNYPEDRLYNSSLSKEIIYHKC